MTALTPSPKSVLLVGGPDAGKSNYLGRLWMALDASTGTIAKNGLPSQLEYLRTVASALLGGDFAPRTSQGVFQPTDVPVKWQENGTTVSGNLIVPDCAGEQWERIHQIREWSSDWENAVTSMAGCLLFYRVSSSHNVPALDWSSDLELLRYVAGQNAPSDARPDVKLPTQIVLVDWLQCLRSAYRDLHGPEKPLRVAVVLSAWDMAPKEAKTNDPDAYLSTELPLLHDFLSTNTSSFMSRTFGVSVVGGDLANAVPDFKTKYLDGDPNVAGFVAFSSRGKLLESKDLTLPLAWAFGCPIDDVMDQQGRSQ